MTRNTARFFRIAIFFTSVPYSFCYHVFCVGCRYGPRRREPGSSSPRVQRPWPRLTPSLKTFWRYGYRLVLCCLESRGHGRGWRRHWEPSKGMDNLHVLYCLKSRGHGRGWHCHWEPSKGMGNTCMFLDVSSPEAEAEADAVIENLLKVGGICACSLLSLVQRSWPRLTLSLRTF